MKTIIISLCVLLSSFCFAENAPYINIQVEVRGLEKIAEELKSQGESMNIYLDSMTNTLSRIADKDELTPEDREMVNRLSEAIVNSSTLLNNSIEVIPSTIKESNKEILAILDAAFTNAHHNIELIKTEHISPLIHDVNKQTNRQINKVIAWVVVILLLIVVVVYIIVHTKLFKPLYELVKAIKDFPEQWSRATDNLRELNDDIQESIENSKENLVAEEDSGLIKEPLETDLEES